LEALQRARTEMSCSLTPLPQVFAEIEKHGGSLVRGFFRRCRQDMAKQEHYDFSVLWTKRVRQFFGERLRREELECLESAGTILGRYDAESQLFSLGQVVEQMGGYLNVAQAEREQRGRVYGAMGLFVSAAVVIVLL